ncbi:unnamed protein product [Urochloa decumbens]|uniref:Uncharacterized protein n=1 Tax=Urochloa decumbens TaxID=240449 RepID=A0ABC9AB53_9POAL
MESCETSAAQTEESHGATALHKDGNAKRFLDILSVRAAPCRELWLHRLALARTVDWHALGARCKSWARHPANAALLVWLAFVGAGVALVFLLMTGALDSAVPDASRRRRWTEAANQVLNALFTVMCVYQHPRLCHHLVLLLRWRAADAAELRGVYCSKYKNAAGAGPFRRRRREERLHVAVVLALLHATCLAQYAYCGLFWVFDSETRPDWAVNLCMALGLGFPVAAALYVLYGIKSSNGEEDATAVDEEDKSIAVNDRCRVVSATKAAEWAGGLLDLADDPAVAAVSVACTFCVFGWNMERLGFGNMYVHAITFALLCAAPMVVFAVAALKIHGAGALGPLVAAAGALLCVLGLLYGGFWRARMRTRLGLPGDDRPSVCGARPGPAAADYVKWLLCAPCALAQEVRTANLYQYHYDVEEGGASVEETPAAMEPLDRDGRVVPFTAGNAVAVHAPPVPVMVQLRSDSDFC